VAAEPLSNRSAAWPGGDSRKAIGLGEFLELQRTIPGGVDAASKQRLGHLDGVAGHRFDSLAPQSGLVEQPLVGHDLLHNAKLKRLFGADMPTGQVVRHCPVIAKAAGQEPTRPDFWNEAQPAEGGDEYGALRGDQEIAGKREREPYPCGGPIDRGDKMLVRRRDGSYDAAELPANPTP
jgi:hypothetical protein